MAGRANAFSPTKLMPSRSTVNRRACFLTPPWSLLRTSTAAIDSSASFLNIVAGRASIQVARSSLTLPVPGFHSTVSSLMSDVRGTVFADSLHKIEAVDRADVFADLSNQIEADGRADMFADLSNQIEADDRADMFAD
eukprot:1236146-Pyramimonas_sp.AAC.1